jgi:hypothetical protein
MLTATMQEAHATYLPGGSCRDDRARNYPANDDPVSNDSARPGALAGQGQSIASAYLDQFNQMVELIERLPSAPELISELLDWRPTSYHDYYAATALPSRVPAADGCATLSRHLRKSFEGVAVDLDCKALGAAAAIRHHYKTHGEARPDMMTDLCTRAGTYLREALGKANALVNHVPGGITGVKSLSLLGATAH